MKMMVEMLSKYLMMRMFMLVISMVSPHQCMNPATSMQVNSTHIITNIEPRQLPRVMRVVAKMQTKKILEIVSEKKEN